MTVDQLANVPGVLKIEGFDSTNATVCREIPVAKSLPAAVVVALARDLIALGKEWLTPYHRVRPQLKALAAMCAAEASPTERDQIFNDRQTILNNLTTGLISGRADDLAAEAYWVEGRKSVTGLHREIIERAKAAGSPISLLDIAAIVTVANASLVLASLQECLGEPEDPTAGT